MQFGDKTEWLREYLRVTIAHLDSYSFQNQTLV
jgi:hypothetical protein